MKNVTKNIVKIPTFDTQRGLSVRVGLTIESNSILGC